MCGMNKLTHAERTEIISLLILTADLTLVLARPGYATLDQIKAMRESLEAARHALDGETAQLSLLPDSST